MDGHIGKLVVQQVPSSRLLSLFCFRFVQMKSEWNLLCSFSVYRLKHYYMLLAEETRTVDMEKTSCG